jgi:hypothetical protein
MAIKLIGFKMEIKNIHNAINFLCNFYEKFEFHKDLAVVALGQREITTDTINYVELHGEVINALNVSKHLSAKGYLIFLTIQQHLEKVHKETFVWSKYQENGEKNKSPVLVNILYDKLTKERFSQSVMHRIESLKCMEKAFS